MSQKENLRSSWRRLFNDLEYEIGQKIGHYVVTCDEYAFVEDHAYLIEEISKGYPLPIKLITNDGQEASYWTNGVNHNPDGPARRFNYGPNNNLILYTAPDGIMHNPGGPARISRSPSTYEEIWTNHLGKLHREDGPAYRYLEYDREQRGIVPFFPELPGYGSTFFSPEHTFEPMREARDEWHTHGVLIKRWSEKLSLQQKFLADEQDISLGFETRRHVETTSWEFFEPVPRTQESEPLLHRVDGPAQIIFRDSYTVTREGQTKVVSERPPEYRWYVRGDPLMGVEKFFKQARIDLKTNNPEKSFFRSSQDHMIFMSRINDLIVKPRF